VKVALLTAYDPLGSKFGGSEISTLLLAKGMVSLGVEPHILTIPSHSRKASENIHGIHFHRIFTELKAFRLKGAPVSVILCSKIMAKKIHSIYLKTGFTVIDCQNRDTSISGVFASQRLKVPCILHIRDFWPVCLKGDLYPTLDEKCTPNSTYCIRCYALSGDAENSYLIRAAWSPFAYVHRILRKQIIQRATHFIAVSQFVKDILVKSGFSKDTISVVPNPVETLNDAKTRKNHSLAKRLLYIGVLREDKGALDLLPLMNRLWKFFPHLNLTIVGSGPLEHFLKRYFSRTKPRQVRFTGWLPYSQVNKEYAQADIVVLPFRRPEAFGRVLAEAMAAGKPVVSYKVGGVAEVVQDRVTGFLVDKGDINGLCDAVKRLVVDKSLRRRMGEAGRQACLKKYDPIQIAKQTLKIYDKIL